MKRHILRNPERRIVLLVFLLLAGNITLYAQQYRDHREHTAIDSMEQILEKNPPGGTDLLYLYQCLAYAYSELSNEKSYKYAHMGLELAGKGDFPLGEARFLRRIGTVHYSEARYDSALHYFNRTIEALDRAVESKRYDAMELTDQYGMIYGTIGNLYNIQGLCHEAIDYYTRALRIFEAQDSKAVQAIAYSNIGQMYLTLENYGQAETNFKKTKALGEELKDSLVIVMALRGLCMVQLNHGNYGEARQLGETAYAYYMSHPEEGANKIEVQNLLADIYLHGYGDDQRAEEYVRNALAAADTLDFTMEKAKTMHLLSDIHLHRRQWKPAEQAALQALAIDESEPGHAISLYRNLSKAYSHLGNPDKADEYADKAHELQASWSTRNYQSALSEQEVRYETEKKEIRIASLEDEKRLMAWLTIAGCSLALLILLLLFYRNRLHRRQRQLLATRVALESETAERQRLAKDLHDGLGGMLSLVKINIDAGNAAQARELLDSSITELRRVAHHIMPDTLVEHGLKTSLEDFAMAVPGAGFHFFGEEKRLDTRLEVVLYRAAYELVNNALKHAAARHIDVQLIQKPGRISLSVSDDGKGFDTEQEAQGIGLKNIRKRISVYDGEMHILSDAESGTEIRIEISLNKTGGEK